MAGRLLALLLAVLGGLVAPLAMAQSEDALPPDALVDPAPYRAEAKQAVEQSPRWRELLPAQQAALKPLESEWPVIDAARKQTWLELAGRFSSISPAEQARVQERMAEWVRMTPQQRGAARLRFQELKQVPPQDRQARWNAYQALSPEQKQALAARAAPAVGQQMGAAKTRPPEPPEPPLRRSTILPNPTSGNASAQSIAPTLVQARPGATTLLVTKRPAPPLREPFGATKIYVTPDVIDKATLLPKRGPQSAAAASARMSSRPSAAP